MSTRVCELKDSYGSMASRQDNWIREGDVVLEMSPLSPAATAEKPSLTRNNVLTLDKRRAEALTKMQSLLKDQASHQQLQEAMLTKDKFCIVFARTVGWWSINNLF